MSGHADDDYPGFGPLLVESLTGERDALLAENQRLREALEWYADSPSPGLRERAEKALAGDAE